MQLDRTRIAIRERSYPDLLDLALRVTRVHAWPLAVALAAGVAPFALLNAWLLGRPYSNLESGFPIGYVFGMAMLVVWEIPLATAPATLYLGRAMFAERPLPREIAADMLRAAPQLILFQGIVRAILILPVFTWFFPFVWWPHLNEVILLDRNPFRARRPGQVTTYRRTMSLHDGYAGELFGRCLAAFGASVFLGGALLASISLLRSLFLVHADWGQWWAWWRWDPPMYTTYLPLTAWLVAGFFTVVRFLGYLDLRIRREGWEVELLMRAEGAKLSRQLT